MGRPSKAQPFKTFVVDLLLKEPNLRSLEIVSRARAAGYDGGKSALYSLIASVRPRRTRPLSDHDRVPGEIARHGFGQVDVRYREGGERTLTADEFFVGVFETAVREGELLTWIDVPAGGKGVGDGMAGVTLGAHGTYIANAAAAVADGKWRIALGCVGAVPVRATTVEEKLAGADVDEGAARAAVEGLGATLDPPSDVHASADYRRHLAAVLAARAVNEAA